MKKILTNMILGGTMFLFSFAEDVKAQSKHNGSLSLNEKQQSIITISAFTANGNRGAIKPIFE